MLVYGDAVRREAAADKLTAVRGLFKRIEALDEGLERHSALIAALIESGELAQGIADAEFAAAGECETPSPPTRACMALVMAVAACCSESWSSSFAHVPALPFDELARCEPLIPSGLIDVKQPEGYAFYAVYPEAWFEAARGLSRHQWQVFGVRSIGTSLACMVAAGLHAGPPITLRPIGQPFDRRIAASRIAIEPTLGNHAVVDEGPGLSGSSMAAVAQWLVQQQVPADRLHFFPSHDNGPGPRASTGTRALWRAAHVHFVGFDELFVETHAPARHIGTWVAQAVGFLERPLTDIGNGRWRALQTRESDLPPSHPWQERRKFLAAANGSRWLVKFAGLGRYGAETFRRALILAEAGFTPEAIALRHGFLIERWRDDLRPLPAQVQGELRTRLVTCIGDYLAFRARSFAAPSASGASMEELYRMGRHNTEQALGSELGSVWDQWRRTLPDLAQSVHRVETDNRMHAWEWLADAESILKTDAVDHHAGHDLIGCQDIAWDIAGAAVELELGRDELGTVIERISRVTGRRPDRDLLDFVQPCYVAFQLGYYHEAKAGSGDVHEIARLDAALTRYSGALRQILEHGSLTA